MKKLLIGFGLMLSYAAVSAQTADDIVTKYIVAQGGKDNIEKVKSVVMEGSMNVQGNDVAITVTKVQGKVGRQDISMGGMNGYQLVTDKEGWGFMPFLGQQKAEAFTADQVKGAQSDLDIAGPLYNYQTKGNKITLAGQEDVSGSKCFVLNMVDSLGKSATYYINDSSYLLARVKQQKEMMGQKMDVTVDFANYKAVEGVKMPFSLTQQYGTVIFSSIKVNTDIDDKVYKHD